MTVSPANGAQATSVSALDPKAAEAIGRALKADYAEFAHAPLPRRLMELLARLKVADRLSELPGRRDASE
jgi:Anti-sigma factor NepR